MTPSIALSPHDEDCGHVHFSSQDKTRKPHDRRLSNSPYAADKSPPGSGSLDACVCSSSFLGDQEQKRPHLTSRALLSGHHRNKARGTSATVSWAPWRAGAHPGWTWFGNGKVCVLLVPHQRHEYPLPCPDRPVFVFSNSFFKFCSFHYCSSLFFVSCSNSSDNRIRVRYEVIVMPDGQFCPKPYPRSWMGCLRSGAHPSPTNCGQGGEVPGSRKAPTGTTEGVWVSRGFVAQDSLLLPLSHKRCQIIVNIYGEYIV